MADGAVLITISAKDLASAVFRQLGADAKAGLGKAAKGLEKYQAGLEKAGKAATDMGKKMSVGVTAPLALFAGVAINSAVKAERLTKTLEGLAGGADRAASFIDAIKTASLGTIPQVAALEIANRALSFGVVETEEQMASLVETAIVLGKAQGLDAATAVSDLTTALSRQSPMILDNLGITLKMSEASAIAAENAHKFGLEADNLTKAQEFQIAALTKGQAAVAKMGGMQEDMATKVERAKAQVSDLTTTLGVSLIPVLQAGLGVVTPLVTGFANMSPEMQKTVVIMAGIAAAAGPAITAFGTVLTVTSKLPAAMAKAKAAMAATNVTMLGLGAAVVVLAVAANRLNNEMKKMNAATDEAVNVASTWSDKAQVMIDDGGSLGDALSVLADKQNTVSKAWNDNIVTGTAIGGIFGTNAKINKVYAETSGQVNKIIVKNSADFKDYTATVTSYNAQIDDGAAKTDVFTEAQFNMASIMEKGASDASLLADSILKQNLVMEESAAQANQLSVAQQENLRNIDMLSTSQDRAAQRAGQMGAAVAMSGEQIGATGDAVEAHRARIEQVARVTDMQAASAQRQAAALEASRQVALAAAEAQVTLAGSLKGATDAQIASALIEQLDPEALGAAAFAEGVTAIQVAFGLADEKSIALAENIGPLAEAMNDGIIPTEDFDEALAALIQDAADGEVNTGLLLDQFARTPGLIGPSEEKLKSFNEKLVATGEDATAGEEGLTNFGSASEGIVSQVDTLTDSVIRLNDELGKVGSTTLPGIPGAGNIPRGQFGGRVPGPLGGPPRLIIAEPGETLTPPSQISSPTNNFGRNTTNVVINDQLGAALFLSRMDTESRFEARM